MGTYCVKARAAFSVTAAAGTRRALSSIGRAYSGGRRARREHGDGISDADSVCLIQEQSLRGGFSEPFGVSVTVPSRGSQTLV